MVNHTRSGWIHRDWGTRRGRECLLILLPTEDAGVFDVLAEVSREREGLSFMWRDYKLPRATGDSGLDAIVRTVAREFGDETSQTFHRGFYDLGFSASMADLLSGRARLVHDWWPKGGGD